MDNEFIKRTLSSIILFPLVILVILEGKIIFNLFLILCLLLVLNEWSRMKINKILYYIGFIYLIFSEMMSITILKNLKGISKSINSHR